MAKFKWTVEFEVDEVWVADGFIMTDQRALDMLAADLGWADIGSELSAKVILHPNLDAIAYVQGYEDAKHMLRNDPQLQKDLLAHDAR